eukprot:5068639-Amphidinium_carterae.2
MLRKVLGSQIQDVQGYWNCATTWAQFYSCGSTATTLVLNNPRLHHALTSVYSALPQLKRGNRWSVVLCEGCILVASNHEGAWQVPQELQYYLGDAFGNEFGWICECARFANKRLFLTAAKVSAYSTYFARLWLGHSAWPLSDRRMQHSRTARRWRCFHPELEAQGGKHREETRPLSEGRGSSLNSCTQSVAVCATSDYACAVLHWEGNYVWRGYHFVLGSIIYVPLLLDCVHLVVYLSLLGSLNGNRLRLVLETKGRLLVVPYDISDNLKVLPWK